VLFQIGGAVEVLAEDVGVVVKTPGAVVKVADVVVGIGVITTPAPGVAPPQKPAAGKTTESAFHGSG
jgi:hypothetical protein